MGLLVLGIATAVFADLAEDVANGEPLTITDARFSAWLHAHATPPLTAVMLVITNLHSTIGITLLTMIFAILLWRWRARSRILEFVATVYCGMLLNYWLKDIFQRARPHFNDYLAIATGFSFPSGHTMAATVFYGMLAATVIPRMQSKAHKFMMIMLAVVMAALVGFSRIYLGVHYLSDVVGAMVEGVGWLAICCTAFETLHRRRAIAASNLK